MLYTKMQNDIDIIHARNYNKLTNYVMDYVHNSRGGKGVS